MLRKIVTSNVMYTAIVISGLKCAKPVSHGLRQTRQDRVTEHFALYVRQNKQTPLLLYCTLLHVT